VDLTKQLSPGGRLDWNVPPGRWTIMRFGRALTGQTTRPAPKPGLGFETDKFDRAALDAHFAAYVQKILARIGPRTNAHGGLTMLHFDSWEMSSQNWSPGFRDEFRKRRGYDPLKFLPALSGWMVGGEEMSERFLWDLRRTAQELVVENQVGYLKELSHRNGLTLSVEPYDLNPAAMRILASRFRHDLQRLRGGLHRPHLRPQRVRRRGLHQQSGRRLEGRSRFLESAGRLGVLLGRKPF
jgi:hypothetical protein